MRTSVLSIPQARGPLRDGLDWAAAPWRESAPQSMDFFLPRTHAFRPTVQFKLARDETCVAVLFRVQDQFARSVCREVNGPVCQDSCVEWFVQPVPGKGYLNFEVNAGGCPHISYVEDPRRLPDGGLKKRRFPTPAETAGARVLTSLPATFVDVVNALRKPRAAKRNNKVGKPMPERNMKMAAPGPVDRSSASKMMFGSVMALVDPTLPTAGCAGRGRCRF